MEHAEGTVIAAVNWLRLGVEAIGAAIIGFGIVMALVQLVFYMGKRGRFHHVRLVLAGYLALALEFQLAADILSTAVAPSWDQIGKLAAIAVIRTALNFFLMQEMKEAAPAPPSGASAEHEEHRADQA